MEELLKTFMEQTTEHLSQISNQVGQLSKDIVELKEGVSRLEGRMDKLEGKMDILERRMDKLEERQLILESNQQDFDLSLKHFASEFRSHFGKIETELEHHREAFKVYAADLHHIKTDVEFLSGKTGIHDTKINNIEKRLEV